MPLEAGVCLSGLVFQQADLCKIKMGRAGLCWCCWHSEGALQHRKSSYMGETSSRMNLQGHVLEENHFHAACLVSREQKCSGAVSHPADLNLFNGAVLFHCADILMPVLQRISGKLPKHRIHGAFLLRCLGSILNADKSPGQDWREDSLLISSLSDTGRSCWQPVPLKVELLGCPSHWTPGMAQCLQCDPGVTCLLGKSAFLCCLEEQNWAQRQVLAAWEWYRIASYSCMLLGAQGSLLPSACPAWLSKGVAVHSAF